MSEKPVICIATPAYGGQVTTQYLGGMMQTTQWMAANEIGYQLYMLGAESQVHRARNKCVAYAKQRQFTHLLFIDADLGFSHQHLELLINANKRIIGGTYPIKKLPPSLNFNPLKEHAECFGAVKTAAEWDFYVKHVAPPDGVIEVQHVPTGFLLIDMGVFEALDERLAIPATAYTDQSTGKKEPYWEYFRPGIHAGQDESEDWMFSRICREAGESVWLHTGVVLPHVGTYEYRAEVHSE